MKKRKVVLSLFVAMSLMLVGCGSAGNESDNNINEEEVVTNSSKNGISIYVGTNIFESSLDPIKGAMSYGYSFTNCALTRVNPNSEYEGYLSKVSLS